MHSRATANEMDDVADSWDGCYSVGVSSAYVPQTGEVLASPVRREQG